MLETQETMEAYQSRKRRRLDVESSQMLGTDPQTDQVLPESEPVEDEVVEERSLHKPKGVLHSDKVSESSAAIAKTGVVYLSRIPPRLSPTKMRQLLTPFGSSILRIFLAPESTAEHTRRVKAGGSKRRQFTEGWVEFENKMIAKKVAGLLNAQRIGTKKGDFWYDDLWCLKYLPKFKWHHLTEQIAYQNASRKEKLRNEIAQEKRENLAFVQNTERSKMIENIQRKRKEKGDDGTESMKETKLRRHFAQKSVVLGLQKKASNVVLSKVFE